MPRPNDIRYTETHEWVRVDGAIAIVGITDHAVEALSDLVSIQLPKVGAQIQEGTPFGEIESVKAVSELVAPVTGAVTEVHAALAEDLDVLSRAPFGDGWLVKVRMSDPSEVDDLMSREEYDAHVDEEH